MEIRDQMTATVRLTKQAAERLGAFLSGLKNQPKNMNDALNLALSDLPRNSFIDEVWELQKDNTQSLADIKHRFDQTGFLKRSNYYFMVLIARQACSLKEVTRIQKPFFQDALQMTLDLWALCKKRDPEGHFERYMLGNVGGNSFSDDEVTLENYLPKYMERTEHPFSGGLDFALRNPEVMLRDELSNISDIQINNKMAPYFPMLYRIAARWHYITTKEPIIENANLNYANRIFKHFGDRNELSFSQYDNQNVGFALAGSKKMPVVLVANNIMDVEEYLSAFIEFVDEPDSYSGRILTLHKPHKDRPDGEYIFMTPNVSVHLPVVEFNAMASLLKEMSEDPDVRKAFDMAKEKFGEI